MGKPFSETLRAALRNAPDTRYRISKETGIPQTNLSRFVHGTRGLSLSNLDILCEHLGLQLVSADKAKGK